VTGPLNVGADLLAALTTEDLDVLRQDLIAGWYKHKRVHGGCGTAGEGWWIEGADLLDDLQAAWEFAFEREVGAEKADRVERSIRLDHIAEAEQLLAAGRAGGAR
jgi:hypothetical protein